MTAGVAVWIVATAVVLAGTALRRPGRSVVVAGSDSGPLGVAGGVVVAALVAGPVGAVPVALVAYVRSVMRRRRRVREREHRIRAGLAEVVDLFAVALASGHNLYAATQRVAQWSGEPFSQALADCVTAVDHDHPLGDSLEELATRLGPVVQPLVTALVAHERYGAPIAQNLAALAGESRRARRHDAEVVARRLPVILLGPLVVCVLPAFLLLTVVPLVVDTVGSFAESFGF